MKIFLVILASFLLLTCSEPIHDNSPQCFNVTFADALPVKFWLNDCSTYNESIPQGVHYKCFCHEWGCDDEIRVQFTDEDYTKDYKIHVLDDSDNILDTFDFVKSIQYQTEEIELSFFNDSFGVSISGWDQLASGSFGSGQVFTWNNPSSARADASVSALHETSAIGQDRTDFNRPWPIGDYQVRIRAVNTSTGGSAPLTSALAIYGSDLVSALGSSIAYTGAGTFDVGAGSTEITVNFTLTEAKEFLWFEFYKQGPSGGYKVILTIDYITLDSAPTTEEIPYQAVYDYTIPLTDYCGQKIRFEVYEDVSPENIIAKTDCLLVSEVIAGPTILIEYSNENNFNGLVYENISPETTFQVRIPAILFHERFPSDREVAELSSSKIINLNSAMRAQKLLETDYLPYYFHQKIQLILMHDTVLIDGKYWTYNEAYEIQEGERRWPVKKAKCWLNDRDFVQRNVI